VYRALPVIIGYLCKGCSHDCLFALRCCAPKYSFTHHIKTSDTDGHPSEMLLWVGKALAASTCCWWCVVCSSSSPMNRSAASLAHHSRILHHSLHFISSCPTLTSNVSTIQGPGMPCLLSSFSLFVALPSTLGRCHSCLFGTDAWASKQRSYNQRHIAP
jgi:hypothetical protein